MRRLFFLSLILVMICKKNTRISDPEVFISGGANVKRLLDTVGQSLFSLITFYVPIGEGEGSSKFSCIRGGYVEFKGKIKEKKVETILKFVFCQTEFPLIQGEIKMKGNIIEEKRGENYSEVKAKMEIDLSNLVFSVATTKGTYDIKTLGGFFYEERVSLGGEMGRYDIYVDSFEMIITGIVEGFEVGKGETKYEIKVYGKGEGKILQSLQKIEGDMQIEELKIKGANNIEVKNSIMRFETSGLGTYFTSYFSGVVKAWCGEKEGEGEVLITEKGEVEDLSCNMMYKNGKDYKEHQGECLDCFNDIFIFGYIIVPRTSFVPFGFSF